MTLKDDLGRAVTLPASAQRVISLTPATTENLFAIGAGKRVAGVTAADDYPPAVRKLPRVGDFGRPSYEQLFALKPDLVVLESATITLTEAEALARKVRCPVFVQRSQRVMDIPRHLRQLGVLTGVSPNAEKVARAFEARAARVPRAPRPWRVFVEVSQVPLYAAGPGSFVDDVIRQAGGANAITRGGPFPQISKEALLAARPDLYVVAGNKRQGTLAILPDLLFRPTPRLLEGLEALAAALRAKK